MVGEASMDQLSSLRSAQSIKAVAGLVSEIAGKKIEDMTKKEIQQTLVKAFENFYAPTNAGGTKNSHYVLAQRFNISTGAFEFNDTKDVSKALAKKIDDEFIIKGEVPGSFSATGSKFDKAVSDLIDKTPPAKLGHSLRDFRQSQLDKVEGWAK
ncbi:MAG: hypothetical protein WCH76_02325 [Candidatus Riflemargulisbacteria bacterium]